MKIAVNSRIYEEKHTGIAYYIQNLYRRSDPAKQEVVFLQSSLKKVVDPEAGATQTPKWRLPGLLGAVYFDLIGVHGLINKVKPDIFHAPSNILPLFRRRGTKYILSVMDCAFLVFPEHYSKIFNLYYTWAARRSAQKADLIIAISEATKRDVIRFFKVAPEKVRVSLLGVDTSFFAQQSLPQVVEGDYLLSVTTHPIRKNVVRVIEALAKSTALASYTYCLVGKIDPSTVQEIENLAYKLHIAKRVKVFGYASDEQLQSLYQHAQFCIYPSLYEGFGLPVIEAMARRCPIIAGNNSSMVEIMPDAEYLVEATDTGGIQRKMEKLISLSATEREKLIERNYVFAKQFTWERTAEQTWRHFEEAV
jgi:glycosyltransferase involved in cell wall biosynthesis